MSRLFNQLAGFPRTPAGREREFLRATPRLLWRGSLVILHWTMLLTVGIAAFIVRVMKGPAYVADAYPLDDEGAAERPTR